MNRLNILTSGVTDIGKSLTFYRDGLGFETSEENENPAVVFFNNAGTKLALYPLDELVKDINEKESPATGQFSGITLAYNAKSAEEVDEVMEKAKRQALLLRNSLNVFFGADIAVILQIRMVITGKWHLVIIGSLMKMIC